MAIKQLSQEQIRSMTLEEKDAWWLKHVYRGDMPQLTLRSAITGMILGAFLSLTNLYIGARTGWSLGVGVTSVILSFAFFKVLSKMRIGREMTILENNAMQSIATSAGYMNSPLFTSFAAYAMITMTIMPMTQVFVLLCLFAILGVLFAFPMKKRFINDEQLPFPEGMAAGVVMEALHEGSEEDGLFKARLLAWCGSVAAIIELLRDDLLMRVLFALDPLPAYWDSFLYGDGKLAKLLRDKAMVPKIMGVELRELTIRWDTSIVFVATGGLMGIGAGASMLLGGVLNYFILAPMMIARGIITPNITTGHFGLEKIAEWALWGGVACMTTSSLYSFFSKPKVIVDAFAKFFKKGGGEKKVDVLAHIELPIWVSLVGVPIASIVLVVLGKMWFGIEVWLGLLAVPLVFVFSLISVNSTGLTSITPAGALGKLTQLTYAVLAPNKILTNVMTASISSEVSSNAANLLMDIKPGYMLGGKPRHQAVGHLLGAVSGLILSLPIWYWVLIKGEISRYGSERFPVPGAIQWKAVAEVLMRGLENLHSTSRWAIVIGAAIGVAVEVSKQVTKGRFPLSAVGLGLAFVISFRDIWTMFLGSFIFWLITRRAKSWKKANGIPDEETDAESPPAVEKEAEPEVAPAPATSSIKRPWYAIASENVETICAGAIAGGALMGIAVNVLDELILDRPKEAAAMAPFVARELEPNDSVPSANGPYSPGLPVRGEIAGKGDVDYVSIALPSKGSAAIKLSGGCSKAALDVALYDPVGEVVLASAEGKADACPSIDAKAAGKLAAGKYFVKIAARGEPSGPIAYTLDVTFTADEGAAP